MVVDEQAELTLTGRLTRSELVFLRFWIARRRFLPKCIAAALTSAATMIAISLTSAASPAAHLLVAVKLCVVVGGLLLVVCIIAALMIVLRTRAPKDDTTVRFTGDAISISRADGTALRLPPGKTTLRPSRLGVLATLDGRGFLLLPYRALTAEQLAVLVKYHGLLRREPASRRPGHLPAKTGLTLIGGVCGIALAVAVLIVKPWQDFTSAFDTNLADNAPFDAALVIADPALHAHLLRNTAAAYAKGGWDAASMTLKMVMISDVIPYASDDQVLAYERAKLALVSKLAEDPAACLRYAIDGDLGGKLRGVDAETSALNNATWSAVRDGLARKQHGAVWYAASAEQVDAVWRTIEFGRYPLSHAEIQLLTYARLDQRDPARLPASMLCSASIKAERNVLAFVPESDAAYAARIIMSQMDGVASGPRIKPTPAEAQPQHAQR